MSAANTNNNTGGSAKMEDDTEREIAKAVVALPIPTATLKKQLSFSGQPPVVISANPSTVAAAIAAVATSPAATPSEAKAAAAPAAAAVAAGEDIKSPKSPSTPPLSPTGGKASVHVPSNLSIAEAGVEIKYVACMVLSGVGDALGYFNGRWEFNRRGTEIHSHMMKLTNGKGCLELVPSYPQWRLSDDTIMHIATAKGFIITPPKGEPATFLQRCQLIAAAYSDCMEDMSGRAPGGMTCSSMSNISSDGKGWDQIPYSNHAGGCGAAMRSMCIGAVFPNPGPDDERAVISYGIETGRTTHHNPNGYLGSVAGGLFTRYALMGVPVVEWGVRLLKSLHDGEVYILHTGRQAQKNVDNQYFRRAWIKYLKARGLVRDPISTDAKSDLITGLDGATDAVVATGAANPTFPAIYGVEERDAFYHSVSFDGWGGSSGHDAPMIAYDALMSALRWLKPIATPATAADAKSSSAAASSAAPAAPPALNYAAAYEQLVLHGVLHGGDSDSTGCMALAWWGAAYGFAGVPNNHYAGLEYYSGLVGLGQQLYQIAKAAAATGAAAKPTAAAATATATASAGASIARYAWPTASEADQLIAASVAASKQSAAPIAEE